MPSNLDGDAAGLLMLEEADGQSYRLAFGNWYVLTRYNRSRLYATAVWDLAQALLKARGEPPSETAPATSGPASAGDTAH